MGHLIFRAISLKELAIFKPRAILMAVVMALYIFLSFSLMAVLLTHILVDKI